MSRTALLKTGLALAVSLTLCLAPQGAFAQRGGHGGFSGMHGGGFGGFHGGSFGGFRGGGFAGVRNGGFRGPGLGGFRGGFGWRGAYWGYPRFGWGWGVNIGFGLGPYWGWGYPYYGYWPWWGPYAYDYPYPYAYPAPPYDPDSRYNGCDYRYSDGCADDRGREPQDNSKPNNQTAPAKPSNSPARQSSSVLDYRVSNSEDYRVTTLTQPAPTYDSVSYTFAEVTTLQPPEEMRPVVRNVLQALRAMPPDVRERELSSGRYASFSPAEKELLQALLKSDPEK